MPEGHDTINEVSNIMSFVLYTQILKQSVLKPASPGITLNGAFNAILLPYGKTSALQSEDREEYELESHLGQFCFGIFFPCFVILDQTYTNEINNNIHLVSNLLFLGFHIN